MFDFFRRLTFHRVYLLFTPNLSGPRFFRDDAAVRGDWAVLPSASTARGHAHGALQVGEIAHVAFVYSMKRYFLFCCPWQAVMRLSTCAQRRACVCVTSESVDALQLAKSGPTSCTDRVSFEAYISYLASSYKHHFAHGIVPPGAVLGALNLVGQCSSLA